MYFDEAIEESEDEDEKNTGLDNNEEKSRHVIRDEGRKPGGKQIENIDCAIRLELSQKFILLYKERKKTTPKRE